MKRILSNTRLLALAVALLIVSGLSALSTLPRAEDPIINNRNASIITHYPGQQQSALKHSSQKRLRINFENSMKLTILLLFLVLVYRW